MLLPTALFLCASLVAAGGDARSSDLGARASTTVGNMDEIFGGGGWPGFGGLRGLLPFSAGGGGSVSSASAGKQVRASNGFWGGPPGGGDFGGGDFGGGGPGFPGGGDFGGGGFGGPGFPGGGDFGGGGFGGPGPFSASSASAGKNARASNGFWGGPPGGGDFGGGDFGGGGPGFPGGGDFGGGGFGGPGPFSAGSADKSAKTASYGGEKDKDCDEKDGDDYNKAGHRWHKRRTWYRRKNRGSKNQGGDSDCDEDKSDDGSSKY